MISHYWAAGSGPETFSLVFPRFQSEQLSTAYPDFYHESPHNFVLDTGTAQGMPGVIVLFGMCSLAYYAAFRSTGGERRLAGVFASGLTGMIGAHLFTSFIVPTLLGFYLLIVMSVCQNPNAVASRMLKKAAATPLPGGRGSVTGSKHMITFLSRARQQAVLGLFQQPAGQAVLRFGWVPALAALPLAGFLCLYAWRLLSADRSLALARSQLEAGQVHAAQAHYHRSMDQHPRGAIADLWYSRAMALAAQKSDQLQIRLSAWQEGFEAAKRATATADDRHNAWYNIAAFYASQNDFRGTEHSLRSAIRCSPNWFKPHWMLAQVLRESGRLPEAIAEAELAVELNGAKNREVLATLEILRFADSGGNAKK
jgi:hypothetical protein